MPHVKVLWKMFNTIANTFQVSCMLAVQSTCAGGSNEQNKTIKGKLQTLVELQF